jgi:hypothetical protein
LRFPLALALLGSVAVSLIVESRRSRGDGESTSKRDRVRTVVALAAPVLAAVGIYRLFSYLRWVRAIVSMEGPLRVRSRRGWDMTEHVGFLLQLLVRGVVDGELVSLDDEGKPDFPSLCECVLQRHSPIPLTYVFDMLSVEGEPVVSRP